jgi:tetratricopeptide (TPR) repeat protein
MAKSKRVFFIDRFILRLITGLFLTALIFCAAVSPGLANKDESDATPEAAPPKIYSEKEISAFDIAKLKDIAAADSIEQKSPLALYCLAQKYKSAGEVKNSLDSFQKIINAYPAHYLAPKACLEMASIYSAEKNASAEIEILNLISSNYPQYLENLTALYKLAVIMKKNKNIDEMYKKLEEASVLFDGRPQTVPVLFMSANEYLRNYNTKKAAEKFEKLLLIKELTISQRAMALLGKAASFEYNAEPEKALMIYDEILKTQQLDKNILMIAERSKINLEKAPKTPLVKAAEIEAGQQERQAEATAEALLKTKPSRVSEPAAPPSTDGQLKPSTSEVKLRITD